LGRASKDGRAYGVAAKPIPPEQISIQCSSVVSPLVRSRKAAPALWGLAALALFAAALEAVVRFELVPKLVVAAPSEAIPAIWRLAAEEGLFRALGATLLTALGAVTAAVAVGLPAGYWLYKNPRFGLAYRNWLGALFAAPLVLIYPVVLVLFGRTYASTGFMGFLVGLIAIVLYTREGLAAVPETLVRVGRAFNLTPRQEFWKILLPAGTPMIFTGIRLGTIYALVNIIGVEYLINFGGLGFVVSETYDKFDTPGMYAAILFVILVSGFMLWSLKRVQRWLRPA
jgi:NitT/TauT family transport system permease protein